MTIHHDKLAYGKIASLTEEFSEEKLAKMAETLSGGRDRRQFILFGLLQIPLQSPSQGRG